MREPAKSEMVETPGELQNVKISTITPFTKSDHLGVIDAALLDLAGVADSYIPLLFVYKSDGKGEFDASDFVCSVKTSLSKILVSYFPYAGRWIKSYDARVRQLLCNDEGVPFIEAYIDEELDSVVNVKEFVAVEKLAGHKFLGLDPAVFNQCVDFPLPSLFVQATTFKCGGVVLNVSICHMVGDGNAMFTFMNAWSQIALKGETSIVPTHDRSCTMSLSAFLESVGMPSPPDQSEIDEKDRVDAGKEFHLTQRVPQINRTLDVKRETIMKMKAEAAERNLELTTVDLISAHVWRSVNAIPESVDKKTSTIMCEFLDGRARMHNPALPKHYSGNVGLCLVLPRLSAHELSTRSTESVATVVHDNVRSVNPTSWGSRMLETMGLLKDFTSMTGRVALVSSWLWFPVYENDFGCGFGKPIFAACNVSYDYVPSGISVIHPPPPSRTKDTIATVQFILDARNGFAKTLFSDQEFRSIFH